MPLTRDVCYQAILDRNTEYLGLFFTAVTTTGIFCHPTCPARKPKLEHCIFFATADEALAAGFRPCKRCQPLEHPERTPDIVQALVAAVDADPERKWQTADLRAFHTDASTVRRQFKRRFGVTFLAYARARRLGIAAAQIKAGRPVIDAQVASGYESGSGFRDAVTRIIGSAPSRVGTSRVLNAAWFDTKLGPMIAIASETALVLLEFADRRGLEREIRWLREQAHAAIVPGCPAPIEAIQDELRRYFDGTLTAFTTPVELFGTLFQQAVWAALRDIPFGQTLSYSALAASLGKPAAVRAVARANGANPLAVIVPCHRIVGANGELTGYGGGLARKSWLLEHESKGTGA